MTVWGHKHLDTQPWVRGLERGGVTQSGVALGRRIPAGLGGEVGSLASLVGGVGRLSGLSWQLGGERAHGCPQEATEPGGSLGRPMARADHLRQAAALDGDLVP